MTNATSKKMIPNVRGVAVLDVVEGTTSTFFHSKFHKGTALESLPFMHQIIRSRPTSFRSLEMGVQWLLRSGSVKNKEAARISLPSQLIESQNSLGKKEYVWRTDLSKSEQHWEGNFVLR